MAKSVNKKELTKQAQNIAKVSKALPVDFVDQVMNIIPAISEAYAESKRTEIEIARLQCQRDVLIADIKQRYALYENIFQHIFEERSVAIAKYFEVIDKGISENNDTLISQGLQNLSSVVTSSPFMCFSEFSQQLEMGKSFEL